MKARIIAMLVAVGMVLCLGGCASSKGTPAPEVEPVQEAPQENKGGGYTADGLFNLWASGSLTKEEIETMTEAGEISSEAYKEFLSRMSEDVEFNAPEDGSPEGSESAEESESPATNVDASALLTAHVIEYKDGDGYWIRETVRLSPIFRASDIDALVATWETLGGSADEVPVGDECYSWDSRLKSCGFNDAQYIIGDREIANLTEGFDLTVDNCRSFFLGMRVKTDEDTMPLVVRETVPYFPATYVFFADGVEKTSREIALGNAFMDNNLWGPTRFIIILPSETTPNFPNGYDYHDLSFQFKTSATLNASEMFYIPYYGD